MEIISDKQLKELGFTLKKIEQPDLLVDFKYRVAEIKKNNSILEVINEYTNGQITLQYCNIEIIEDGIRNINTSFLSVLKSVITRI